MGRKSLTRKDLTTDQGQSLLHLLMEITSDGDISESEAQQLRSWIAQNGTSLPAADFLKQTLDRVLADGRISFTDRWDILQCIDKVLPPEERALVKISTRGTPEPATPRQLEYLRMLKVRYTDDLTKEQAGDLIDAYKDRHHIEKKPRKRGKKAESSGCVGCLVLLVIVWLLAKCGRQLQSEAPAKVPAPAAAPKHR